MNGAWWKEMNWKPFLDKVANAHLQELLTCCAPWPIICGLQLAKNNCAHALQVVKFKCHGLIKCRQGLSGKSSWMNGSPTSNKGFEVYHKLFWKALAHMAHLAERRQSHWPSKSQPWLQKNDLFTSGGEKTLACEPCTGGKEHVLNIGTSIAHKSFQHNLKTSHVEGYWNLLDGDSSKLHTSQASVHGSESCAEVEDLQAQ